jgi:hypothetical protein
MKAKSRSARAFENATPVERGCERPADQALEQLAGTKGVVFVEYVALLLLVTIGGAAAVLALGAPLINLFRYQSLLLSLPIP